jgi:hypothetical protein
LKIHTYDRGCHQGWVRSLNDHKKWPGAVHSTMISRFLWDEMDFDILVQASFNEWDWDITYTTLNKLYTLLWWLFNANFTS